MAAANARGVVCVHDFQRPGGRGLWQRLDADRRLHLRVHMTVPVEMLGAAAALELRTGFGSELVRVGPVKVFMDGALGSGTAWMLDGSGDALVSAAELAAIAREAAASGSRSRCTPSATRPCGPPWTASRPPAARGRSCPSRRGSSTCQCVDDADLPRFAALGVTASVQPSHAMDDRDLADRVWGERARAAYRWRGLADAGADLAFGSDAPVADARPAGRHPGGRPPHRGRARAVVSRRAPGRARRDPRRSPPAPRHAVGEHRRRGLLLPGYAADLVVLDTDIVAHPDRIADTQVVATMLDGRWVHGAPPW